METTLNFLRHKMLLNEIIGLKIRVEIAVLPFDAFESTVWKNKVFAFSYVVVWTLFDFVNIE